MQLRIPSPRHYENLYGSSPIVRAYLDQIEARVSGSVAPEYMDTLHISLLIAEPELLAAGKFLEYEKSDWRSGYTAIGVNGNFERYHKGNDAEKILQLSEMLQTAFEKIGKKKKSKFDSNLANRIVVQITTAFGKNY